MHVWSFSWKRGGERVTYLHNLDTNIIIDIMKYFIFLILTAVVWGQEPEDVACNQENGDVGNCVSYMLCENNSISTDGSNLLDVRFGEECVTSLEVCCGNEGVLTTPVKPPPVTPPRQSGCGRRNSNGVGVRVTNSKVENSQIGEFPWMVAILRDVIVNGKANQVYKCGGALIHWRAVLTAAHCITSQEQLTARAGEWDTQVTTENVPHQERKVIKSIRHKDFGSGNMFNDIALMILESNFNPSSVVDLICLPPLGQYADLGSCIVTGWGKDKFERDGVYQAVMKKVELPIVTKARCQTMLRDTRLGKKFMLHRSFVCAGGEAGKDSCAGDGGSPLACPIPGETNRYQLAGLVSWGIGCGSANVPGVYANVALYREWIEDQFTYENINDFLDVNNY